MELGEKLCQARQAAGMSQRQLAGDQITRNMLSRIEHGMARPSMDTLKYLADRLSLPVSYFLEEEARTSPNRQVMLAAREKYAAGDPSGALAALADYRGPDDLCGPERQLLQALCRLAAAERAMAEEKFGYARQLLEDPVEADTYCAAELQRRRLLLQSRLPEADIFFLARQLPDLDEELLLRAEGALDTPQRAIRLLEAAADTASPRWQLLRGRAAMAARDYSGAAEYLQRAEDAFPDQAFPLLEQCYRELENYRMAYLYACRRR